MPGSSPRHATTATPAGSRGRSRSAPVIRFRIRVTDGDTVAIGPGKIELLEAVAATGSITAAAKSLGMSYRRAWLLLDALNQALRVPAVDSAKGGQHGGGSAVTEQGLLLIELYRQIEDTAARACAGEIQRLMTLLARG